MRELGQLGVVAEEHHALQLVVEFMDNVKQLIGRDRIQSISDYDFLALVVEFLGDDLRCLERAHGWTRQDQIRLHIALCQPVTYLRRVAPAVIVLLTLPPPNPTLFPSTRTAA